MWKSKALNVSEYERLAVWTSCMSCKKAKDLGVSEHERKTVRILCIKSKNLDESD